MAGDKEPYISAVDHSHTQQRFSSVRGRTGLMLTVSVSNKQFTQVAAERYVIITNHLLAEANHKYLII